jgi:hypothetical protein
MTATKRPRARLGRYLLWQLRDYLLNQGPATALVVALYAYLTIAPLRRTGQGGVAAPPPAESLSAELIAQIFAALLGSFLLLGTLFATNGIVANDRKMGFYRFLFAKPVSAPRYYANAFAANGIGLLIVGLVLASAFAAFVRPVFPPSFIPVVAAMYVAYGGVGFLLSTIWRFDWLSLVTVAILANFGWQMWGDEKGIRGWLVHLLPPTHRAGEVYAFVAGSVGVFPWDALIWLTGYGLACFVFGVWILRVRPLAAP